MGLVESTSFRNSEETEVIIKKILEDYPEVYMNNSQIIRAALIVFRRWLESNRDEQLDTPELLKELRRINKKIDDVKLDILKIKHTL